MEVADELGSILIGGRRELGHKATASRRQGECLITTILVTHAASNQSLATSRSASLEMVTLVMPSRWASAPRVHCVRDKFHRSTVSK